MAYCSNCGAKAEGKYCSVCGTPIEVEKHTSSSANNYKSPYVMEISSKASGQPAYNPGADVANYPMKWHKFMIYFWLWFCAVVDFINGVNFIQISEYSALFGLSGVALIATAVYGIYARFRLAKFKEDGPKQLLYYYYVSIGSYVLMFVFFMSMGMSIDVIFTEVLNPYFLLTIIGALVYCKRYYGVRQNLFIH